MKTFALILGGGKGLRMGADLPKQFLMLGDKPIIMHVLDAFYRANPLTELIVVLPPEQQSYWNELCVTHAFTLEHKLATGGATRFDSVSNGLKLIRETGIIAVHDGVRPLVSTQLINRCFQMAELHGGVVPVCPLVESIRQVEGSTSKAVDRSRYVSVQTPQTFRSEILQQAYNCDYLDVFTDDASVVEAAGFDVVLVEGARENLKITTPMDLLLAEQLLKR